MKKTITITYDVVTAHVELEHDQMAYGELVGLIEYAKMMIMRDWLEEG
jgi:hypothetical protein